MFFQKKVRYLTKVKSFGKVYITVLFILTFLLIFFNKADYIVVNKIKYLSTDVLNPVTRFITSPIKVATQAVNKINEIRFLQQDNLKLKEEVKRLNKWHILAVKNQRENNALKKLLNSTTNNISIIKTTTITSQTPDIYAKSVFIKAGVNHGVSEDFVVINERGLVGKVISSSENNSRVLLINDQHSSVPVTTMSKKINAIIKGTANGKYLTSTFLKDEKKPKIGDILLTSGNARIFPSDILVGKVIKISEDGFLALPYVDFYNLEFVQVINIK
jgi:rod shape-determining protein MreC